MEFSNDIQGFKMEIPSTLDYGVDGKPLNQNFSLTSDIISSLYQLNYNRGLLDRAKKIKESINTNTSIPDNLQLQGISNIPSLFDANEYIKLQIRNRELMQTPYNEASDVLKNTFNVKGDYGELHNFKEDKSEFESPGVTNDIEKMKALRKEALKAKNDAFINDKFGGKEGALETASGLNLFSGNIFQTINPNPSKSAQIATGVLDNIHTGNVYADTAMQGLSTTIKAVDAIGSRKLDNLSFDKQKLAEIGGSYNIGDLLEAEQLSGKSIGGIDVITGKYKNMKKQLNKAKLKFDHTMEIMKDTNNWRALALGNNDLAANLYQYDKSGINPLKVNSQLFKDGGKLDLDVDFEIIEEEINNIPTFKEGGSIWEFVELPWEFVESEEVESFKDGGKPKKEEPKYEGWTSPRNRTMDLLISEALWKNPRFIQRMFEPIKDVDLGNGYRGTHRLSYGNTDKSNEAIVYPEIFEDKNRNLIFDPENALDNALKNKDFLIMTPEEAEMFTKNYKKYFPQFFNKFKNGGEINVIPSGALHKNLHHMDLEGITKKGIPVVSEEEDGKIIQQAEIERNEIILRKSVTEKLEKWRKIFESEESSNKEKNEVALKAGKLLVSEILNNTLDNTGILNE